MKADGARILKILIHKINKHNGEYGLAALCIGDVEATALIFKNYRN